MKSDILSLLQKATVSLSDFLEKVLPQLFDNWWQKGVLATLSFRQQRRVERRGINSLCSLDLAALLRVLDQNWYPISSINVELNIN